MLVAEAGPSLLAPVGRPAPDWMRWPDPRARLAKWWADRLDRHFNAQVAEAPDAPQ